MTADRHERQDQEHERGGQQQPPVDRGPTRIGHRREPARHGSALRGRRGAGQHALAQVDRRRRDVGAKGLLDLGVGQAVGRHASTSNAASSARRAACRRDFTVPSGMPSERAIVASGTRST